MRPMLEGFDAQYAHRLAHDPELFDALVCAKTVGELLMEERWLRPLREDEHWRRLADEAYADAVSIGSFTPTEAYEALRTRDDAYEDYVFTRFDAELQLVVGLRDAFERMPARLMSKKTTERILARQNALAPGDRWGLRALGLMRSHDAHPWILAYEAVLDGVVLGGGHTNRPAELNAVRIAYFQSSRRAVGDIVAHAASVAYDSLAAGTYKRERCDRLGRKRLLITDATSTLVYEHPDLWFVRSGMLSESARTLGAATDLLREAVAFDHRKSTPPPEHSAADEEYAKNVAQEFSSRTDEADVPTFVTAHQGRSLVLDWQGMERDPNLVPAFVASWQLLEGTDAFRATESLELRRMHEELLEPSSGMVALEDAARRLTRRRVHLLMPFLQPDESMQGRGYCSEAELVRGVCDLLPRGSKEADVRNALNEEAEAWGVRRCAFSLDQTPTAAEPGAITNVSRRCPLFLIFEKRERGKKRARAGSSAGGDGKRTRTAIALD